MEVSEGDGQVARVCEDRGFKAKMWVLDGVAADQALPLAMRHLSQKQRLLAGSMNFQQRIPGAALGPSLGDSHCSASPLSHRWRRFTPWHARDAVLGQNGLQRLQIWPTGIDKHDLARLETRCLGARGFCSWSRKKHQSCMGNHLSPLTPSLPHAFVQVVCSSAHVRLFNSWRIPCLRVSASTGKRWEHLSSSLTISFVLGKFGPGPGLEGLCRERYEARKKNTHFARSSGEVDSSNRSKPTVTQNRHASVGFSASVWEFKVPGERLFGLLLVNVFFLEEFRS